MKNKPFQLFLIITFLLLTAWGLWSSSEMKVTQKIEPLNLSDEVILISDGLSYELMLLTDTLFELEKEHTVYEIWDKTPEKVVVLETTYGNFYNTELVNRIFLTIDDIEKVSCDEKVRIQNQYKERCRMIEEAEQEEKIEEENFENLNKKLCVD